MPIRIQADLPAIEVLESENIFVMTHERANVQDIRPLKIAILNLMPTKIETETQLLRLLGNSPLQVDVELLHTATHISKNTSSYHLNTFYKTFSDVKEEKFDGLIITGAPVEQLPFEEVDYWDEMCQIMEWSKDHVYSVLHICWGAQAGLYYHYGIPKYPLPEKLSGIYNHTVLNPYHPLMWRTSRSTPPSFPWRCRTWQACTLWPAKTGGRFLSPATRSTTGTLWPRSTSEM